MRLRLPAHNDRLRSWLRVVQLVTVFVIVMVAFTGSLSVLVSPGIAEWPTGLLEAIGEFMPLALFSGLGAYYFGRWALKHKKLAVFLIASTFTLSYFSFAVTRRAAQPMWTEAVHSNVTTMPYPQPQNLSLSDLQSVQEFIVTQVYNPPQPTLPLLVVMSVQIAILLLLFVFGVLLPLFRGREAAPLLPSVSPARQAVSLALEGARSEVITHYKRALDSLVRQGIVFHESETPRQRERKAYKLLPTLPPGLSPLTRLYEEARYSLHAIGEEHRAQAAAHFNRMAGIEGG